MAGRRRIFARMLTLVLLTGALASAGTLAASAPAFAAEGNLGNSFNELASKAESQTTTTTSTAAKITTTEGSNTTSRTLILAALGAAVVLLSIIAFVIVRDARKVAPAGDADLVEARSARDASVQLRKRRAKARAARQQRKRNR